MRNSPRESKETTTARVVLALRTATDGVRLLGPPYDDDIWDHFEELNAALVALVFDEEGDDS